MRGQRLGAEGDSVAARLASTVAAMLERCGVVPGRQSGGGMYDMTVDVQRCLLLRRARPACRPGRSPA